MTQPHYDQPDLRTFCLLIKRGNSCEFFLAEYDLAKILSTESKFILLNATVTKTFVYDRHTITKASVTLTDVIMSLYATAF